MNDSRIVRFFREGGERALGEAEKKYSRYCTSIAARVLKNAEISKNVTVIIETPILRRSFLRKAVKTA